MVLIAALAGCGSSGSSNSTASKTASSSPPAASSSSGSTGSSSSAQSSSPSFNASYKALQNKAKPLAAEVLQTLQSGGQGSSARFTSELSNQAGRIQTVHDNLAKLTPPKAGSQYNAYLSDMSQVVKDLKTLVAAAKANGSEATGKKDTKALIADMEKAGPDKLAFEKANGIS
ncbi:MAG: hypothetical protein J2O48_01825 [Solirubrobacterales bacterium]|nr:hypothetical protein [Solirubrobacterales bacterium]